LHFNQTRNHNPVTADLTPALRRKNEVIYGIRRTRPQPDEGNAQSRGHQKSNFRNPSALDRRRTTPPSAFGAPAATSIAAGQLLRQPGSEGIVKTLPERKNAFIEFYGAERHGVAGAIFCSL
jgi:hypothetical protein